MQKNFENKIYKNLMSLTPLENKRTGVYTTESIKVKITKYFKI